MNFWNISSNDDDDDQFDQFLTQIQLKNTIPSNRQNIPTQLTEFPTNNNINNNLSPQIRKQSIQNKQQIKYLDLSSSFSSQIVNQNNNKYSINNNNKNNINSGSESSIKESNLNRSNDGKRPSNQTQNKKIQEKPELPPLQWQIYLDYMNICAQDLINSHPIASHNLKQLLQGQYDNQKMAELVCELHNIESYGQTTSIVLKDPFGQCEASILSSMLMEYQEEQQLQIRHNPIQIPKQEGIILHLVNITNRDVQQLDRNVQKWRYFDFLQILLNNQLMDSLFEEELQFNYIGNQGFSQNQMKHYSRNQSLKNSDFITQHIQLDLGEMCNARYLMIKDLKYSCEISVYISEFKNGPNIGIFLNKLIPLNKMRRIQLGSLPCRYIRLVIHKGVHLSENQLKIIGSSSEKLVDNPEFKLLVTNPQRILY